MSLLQKVKAFVGPGVFKKDGQPSFGFGSTTKPVVILDRENWKILEDGVNGLEARVAELEEAIALNTEALGCAASKLAREYSAQNEADAALGAIIRAMSEKKISNHVAWLRYREPKDSERPVAIEVCDSDARGAFKVYVEGDSRLISGISARVAELESIISRILAEEDPDGRRVRFDDARQALAGR